MRRRTTTAVALAAATALGVGVPAVTHALPQAHAESAPYLVGTGIYDITGPAAETGMFGYAHQQEVDGLHDRLYSHAYVIADPASGKRVVFVSADMGAMFQSVKLEVTKRLKARFGDRYDDSNVMLTATHTHVGNSGLSHNLLYEIAGNDRAGYGYDKHTFDTVAQGIVESIARADATLEPGSITVAEGKLVGATKNRSVPAYENNTDAGKFDSDVNQTMTQLTLTAADGTPRGLVNWFAIHPTAFSQKTTRLSADSKGYAQYLTEQKMRSKPTDKQPFVAAFAQSDHGDVVSSQGNNDSSPGFTGDPDDLVNVDVDGTRQYDKSQELAGQQGTQLTGGVDSRFRWVNFTGYKVGPAFTGGEGEKTLCTPARGFSFAVGAENGPSRIPGLYEGMTHGSFDVADSVNKVDTSALGGLTRFAFSSLGAILGAQDPCQAEKQVLLPDGKLGWAPTVLGVQVMRIGDLALVGVPGELTTMSGRRVRALVQEQLKGIGVNKVVIAGMANDYTGYITTREEYAKQNYEGASTEFGPHELGAFEQEFVRLSKAMADGTQVANDTLPRDVVPGDIATRPGVVLDDKPLNEQFGQVLVQPAASYTRGQTATAVFRGGHPKNDFRTMGTFLKVQRQEDGRWVDVRDDHDWDTTYSWKREGVSYSRTTVEWRIGKDVPAGTYRLVQTGDWKNGWNGAISPYTGTSNAFTVR